MSLNTSDTIRRLSDHELVVTIQQRLMDAEELADWNINLSFFDVLYAACDKIRNRHAERSEVDSIVGWLLKDPNYRLPHDIRWQLRSFIEHLDDGHYRRVLARFGYLPA